MSSGIAVAVAGAGEAPAIAALVREVYEPFAGTFPPTALKWTADVVGSRPADWLVARRAGRLVAAVRHGPDAEGYTMDALAVLPTDRRRGVGSRLVAAVEEHARQTAAHQMIIAVRATLTVNVRFFTALGYGVNRPYPPDHHVYTKQIGSPE